MVAIVAYAPFICPAAVAAFGSTKHTAIVGIAPTDPCPTSFDASPDNMAPHPGPNHHILRPFLVQYREPASV